MSSLTVEEEYFGFLRIAAVLGNRIGVRGGKSGMGSGCMQPERELAGNLVTTWSLGGSAVGEQVVGLVPYALPLY